MTVYADSVFAVNALSNELLLYSCCFLSAIKPRHGHIAAASAIGGVYAIIETVFNLPRILRAAVLLCMVYTAFGRRDIIRNTSKIMLMCFAIEGITLAAVSAMGADAALAQGGVVLFASEPITAALYIAAYPVFYIITLLKSRKDRYLRLIIRYGGREAEIDMLRDSGNLLTYHNKPVIMVAWEAAKPLFVASSYDEFKENADAAVIYRTVSGAGIVPVIEPEIMLRNGEAVNAAVAVVERRFKDKYSGIGNIAPEGIL